MSRLKNVGGDAANQPIAAVDVGDAFPPFELSTQHVGKTLSSEDLSGSPAVLYFYPGDYTPGCTLQAGDAQRLVPEFADLGLDVFGVSVNSGESHRGFAARCGLSFPLLADDDGDLSRRLGILTSDPRYPELGEFARRVTFIVDGEGTILWLWTGSSRGHMDEVLKAARTLFRETAAD